MNNDNRARLANVSRREVLKGIAAAAAAALPVGALVAQTGRPRLGSDRRASTLSGRRDRNGRWSVQMVLDLMGKNNISTVILSGGNYGDQVYTGTEAGRTAARKMNDFAAKIVSDHPKSFGFFAVIPFPDADGSLKEIEYAYDTLKADGVGILSSIGDK